MNIADMVWANETAMRSAVQVRSELDNVWRVMRRCVQHGCNTMETVLPGGLEVPRRAPKMYARLASNSDVLGSDRRRADAVLESSDAAWVDLFALAVSEENAGGGRIVTAPTNGAAGVIPAVLHYYWHFVDRLSVQTQCLNLRCRSRMPRGGRNGLFHGGGRTVCRDGRYAATG